MEIDNKGDRLRIRAGSEHNNGPRVVVRSQLTVDDELKGINPARLISAAAWMSVKNRKGGGAKVFSATIADIDKALRIKTYTDPRTKLP